VAGAVINADNGIPFGNLPTDLFEHGIDIGVKHDASIFCRTDQMVHQDGDVVALMDIVTPTSDNNHIPSLLVVTP
jgi:hypothetical protein